MKILRYVAMAVLILGFSGVARASANNGFSWSTNDPTSPLPDVPITDIQPGVPVTFTFSPCDQVFNGVTYTGCAQLLNDSHQAITSLSFTFDNTAGLNSVAVDCSSDVFVVVNCGLTSDDTGYLLSFVTTCSSSGHHSDDDDESNCTCGVPPDDYVYIFENSGDPNFPPVSAVANAPEPSSIWMALSGMGSLGYMLRRKRRKSNQ